MELKDYIRDVSDFPKPGILYRDITPLLQNSRALKETISRMAEGASGWNADIVTGIESRGFVFGTAVAVHMGLGFVPIRKPGKLPFETLSEDYELEYGTDTVELHTDAFEKGQRVLMVDDLLATGGTMAAACKVVERTGAIIAGCSFVIELTGLNGRERIARHPIDRLMSY